MLSGGYCTVLVGCRKAGVDYVEMPLVVVVPWMQCGEILPSFAYMAWYMHGNRQFLRRHVMEVPSKEWSFLHTGIAVLYV
jgi:hypothetical protein